MTHPNDSERAPGTPWGNSALCEPDADLLAAKSAAREREELVRRELGSAFLISHAMDSGRITATGLYAAREVDTQRQIALRVVERTALRVLGIEELFRRATERCARLDHPHIVRTYDSGTTAHFFWYSTQFVEECTTLADIRRTQGPLEIAALLRMMEQASSALHYAHARGVVHGALDPRCLLAGTQGWVLIRDFATASILRTLEAEEMRDATGDGTIGAAPRTIGPEDESPSQDQCDLAATIAECLQPDSDPLADAAANAGDYPGDSQRGRMNPMVPITVPRHVRAALARASSPLPEERYPSVIEFVSALAAPDLQPRAFPAPLQTTDSSHRVLLITRPHKARTWGTLAKLAAAAALVWLLIPLNDGLSRRTAVRELLQSSKTTFETEPVLASPPAPAKTNTPPAAAAADAQAADGAAKDPGTPVRNSARTDVAPPPRNNVAPPPRNNVAPRTQTNTTASRGENGKTRNAASATTPPAAAALPGSLHVSSRPWANLYIDGIRVGETPRSNLSITPGPHRVRLERQGFRAYEMQINVEPGQAMRLIDIVLERINP